VHSTDRVGEVLDAILQPADVDEVDHVGHVITIR
jgi:hypothetical protein